MKIVIAPDSYKECLSSNEVAQFIEYGFQSVFKDAEFVLCPMADGGEGTLQAILRGNPETGKLEKATVTGPLGAKIEASYGILQEKNINTAIIEMAEASGLSLVPKDKRNPLKTTSYGTGELILHALEKGCNKFIICLGGSATCDAGIGALSALGAVFLNSKGEKLEPNETNGEALQHLAKVDTSNIDPRLTSCEFIIAHDVDNPLLGLEGALMYAPQKGATPAEVEILHKGLEQYAFVIEQQTGKNLKDIKGLGSAGGLGATFYAFLNATLENGAEKIINIIHLPDKLKNATLLITGEGKMDGQTIYGKAPIAVARCAKTFNLPVIAIVAKIGQDYEEVYHHGIDAVFSITSGPMSEEDSLNQAKHLLIQASHNIARILKIGLNQ